MYNVNAYEVLSTSHKYYTSDNHMYCFASRITNVLLFGRHVFSFMPVTFEIGHTCIYTLLSSFKHTYIQSTVNMSAQILKGPLKVSLKSKMYPKLV